MHLDKRFKNYEGFAYYLTGHVNGPLVQNEANYNGPNMHLWAKHASMK
jgi:hypothetical protein